MAFFRVRPTRADVQIAKTIAERTNPATERVAQAITWGADEKVLCALAAGWWLYCQNRSASERAAASHILLTTVAVSLIPHALKAIFDQQDVISIGAIEPALSNPDIIYVSMSGLGQTGRSSDYKTFGPVIHAISGLTQMAGLPDVEPALWRWAYMDDTGDIENHGRNPRRGRSR